MSVLVIAPYRPDLPNVATEAAAVVNALGGHLVQGVVREKDVQDAASARQYDGIWFATHAGATPDGDVRVLLSEELLSADALVAYVAASGATWCVINTCQSITLGRRLLRDTQADVICTLKATPDPDAMRVGVLFARQLALVGDPRAAYEGTSPGENYFYLDNYRRGMTVISGSGPYPAQDTNRLQATMDEMRRDMSGMAADIAVLKTRTGTIDVQQREIEARLKEIERQLRPTPTWSTWLMLLIGLVTCFLITALLLRLGGG